MNCVICNKEIEQSSFQNKILCSNECFHIDFWNDKVLNFNPEKGHIVVNGTHYTICKDTPGSYFKGHGGHKFIIEYLNDKHIIESKNVWCQGTIPASYRNKLPDTAKFINKL
jgi:hypothetical protein